ncbi:MAG: nicotinate-nucleotide diphosphorylase (carboxylating) [Planctomycetaceae bacterium]|nr:nicotinate-nucleotide diphosphorylase (carboxylating) [Planctomycetaceae bacterium]
MPTTPITTDPNTLPLDDLFAQLIDPAALDALIDRAFTEDLHDRGDITSQSTIDADQPTTAAIRARQPGIWCGANVIPRIAALHDPSLTITDILPDGSRLTPGQSPARIAGPTRSLLTVERTLLNFVTHLSGIATLTAQYVDAVAHTRAAIFDTRKTIPAFRPLAKHAVRCGGGRCHRIGLFDAMLIKDNHLAHLPLDDWPTAINAAAQRARALPDPPAFIEVEVDNLDQLRRVVDCDLDLILLDNFTPDDMRRAVAVRDDLRPGLPLEASGGVDLTSVRRIAETGVDRIAVGALTHSAPALDLGLDNDNN